MSKYLRTLLVTLLVVSLAVTGAMATEEFPKAARELVWVSLTNGATVTANPDTGNLIIRDKDNGIVAEYPGSSTSTYGSTGIIDPYNDNSTFGQILQNVFFVDTATEAADNYRMRRLGSYAFKFRGEGLPQAFISYNEDSHRYWIPQKLYGVSWDIVTSDEGLEISWDIDYDNDTIVISGQAYPNPVFSDDFGHKDYKITLRGTPYLTTVGEKYYTFDYLEDSMANFPLEWDMVIHVYHDGRVAFSPASDDTFATIVTPASGVNVNVVDMEASNYRVTIKNDQTKDFHIGGGTVRHTYRISLFPGDFVEYYAYFTNITTTSDPDLTPLYTISAGNLYPDLSYIPTNKNGLPLAALDVDGNLIAPEGDTEEGGDETLEYFYLVPFYTSKKLTGTPYLLPVIYQVAWVGDEYDETEQDYTSYVVEGNYYVYSPTADVEPTTLNDDAARIAQITSSDNTYIATLSSNYYVYGELLDFSPAHIVYDSENAVYVYSADNAVKTSFDITAVADAEEDEGDTGGEAYQGSINGLAIRGFYINYYPKTTSDGNYSLWATNPFVYDGVYIPEGLSLIVNYGVELYLTQDVVSADPDDDTHVQNLKKGKVISRTPASYFGSYVAINDYYDVLQFLGYLNENNNAYDTVDDIIVSKLGVLAGADDLEAYLTTSFDKAVTDGTHDEFVEGENYAYSFFVDNYVLSYDPEVAESNIMGVHAGKLMRVTIPLVAVINDAFDDIVRTPLGRTLASGYKLQWNVLFSGDVEDEEEETTPVTPVIAISGDRVINNAVISRDYPFVLSYDSELFGYTLSPDDADFVTEDVDEDGNEVIIITPPAPGTYSVTVTPYDLDSEDNTGTPVTLTVNVSLPGQLTAAFTPATVTVKAGETATSMLEIVNATTGSPAVAGVSPSADWVTYEPRFINGGAFYEFKFAPAATMTAGTHTFTVTVSDDDKTTSAVVTVNVTAAGGDDPTPGPTPSTPAAPTATDLSTFQAALVDNTTTSASVVVVAPSSVTVSSWKVYDNGAEVTDTNKVSIQNNLPNQSARVTVYPDAFDAGDHTLTARYVTTDSTTSNALTLGSFTVADVPVVPVVGKNGGGGCDAGFGALALAAVSLFLLKKRS